MEDLLTGLNPEQVEAIKHENGPALVVAGPGSGKTRVLTHRAAYLVEQGMAAENILLVTFTNKAATEMRSRISELITHNPQLTIIPWSGTFHSICSRILRRDGKFVGVDSNFIIYDTGDGKSLIRKIIKDLDLGEKKINPGAVLGAISSAKSELLDPEEYLSYSHGYFYQTVAQIYPQYRDELHKAHALDFDDLIGLTVKLFKENPRILVRYQKLFKHLLVDEYQDTNKAQYVFAKLLSEAHQNIFVVGDVSQAIYSFRGADYRNILNFERDFPRAKIYHLAQNYRSTPTIVEAAKNIISHNRNHIALDLWTNNEAGGKIKLYEAINEIDEANYIVKTILDEQPTRNSQLTTLNSYAVLYRTNAQSRVIEEVLLHHSLPYILFGGTRFYERKEIKDALSMLRLFSNPNDFASRERVEKIGKRFLTKFSDWLSSRGSDPQGSGPLKSLEILDLVLKKSGYLDLFDLKNEEDLERLENIKELRSVAAAFPSLIDFLEQVALVQEEFLVSQKGRLNQETKPNAVTLMTLHSAKGLEFPTVFMVGLEEGLFPHSRSLLDPSELEEERRLCYVGVTRSMKNLHLTYARFRFYFGAKQNGLVSRFVSEIPQHLLEYKFTDNLMYD